MNTSELIALRGDVVKTLSDLQLRIDVSLNTLMRSEGVKAMYEGMTTKEKMDWIIDEICRYGNVTENEICSYKRYGQKVKWAKIACYILFDYLHVSLFDIADRFNYKNHNSVISHRDTVRGFMEGNDKFNDIMWSTKEILNNLGL
jgi:chromosomal replication initiation ATPase DnaA